MNFWRLLLIDYLGLPEADARSSSSDIDRRASCETILPTRCKYFMGTDYLTELVYTYVTREYYLELTEVTVATDDYWRPAMAVNGTIHGPVLFVDEEDWFSFQYIFHI
jgi:hypothetical protein